MNQKKIKNDETKSPIVFKIKVFTDPKCWAFGTNRNYTRQDNHKLCIKKTQFIST